MKKRNLWMAGAILMFSIASGLHAEDGHTHEHVIQVVVPLIIDAQIVILGCDVFNIRHMQRMTTGIGGQRQQVVGWH